LLECKEIAVVEFVALPRDRVADDQEGFERELAAKFPDRDRLRAAIRKACKSLRAAAGDHDGFECGEPDLGHGAQWKTISRSFSRHNNVAHEI